MQRILVTGGNKGIGLAIVEAILDHAPDTFVYLGSRDEARGSEAAAGLARTHAERKDRIEVVALDVTSDRSVAGAAKRVEGLYAVVNNAGVGVAELLRRSTPTRLAFIGSASRSCRAST